MKLRTCVFTALIAAAGVACGPPPYNYVKLSKPANLGEDSAADIKPGDPNLRAASRKIVVPGEGKLTIDVKAVNGQAKQKINIFSESGGLPVAEGDPPLEADGIAAGTYYVVVQAQNAVATKVKVNVAYVPKDPDQNSSQDGKADGAVSLDSGRATRGSVSYLDLDRTDYFSLNVRDTGTVKFEFRPSDVKGKISAQVQPPKGDFTPIDPRTGLEVKDAPVGNYLVKVQAEENSAGTYVLTATNEAGDPDKNSGDDMNQEGANEMNFKPKAPGPTLLASAKDEVNYDKGDATDWFRFQASDKGKCSIVLKPKDRAAKIKAEYIRRDGTEDGERVKSGFTVDCDKTGPGWVKVYAPDKGDGSPYVLEVEFIPSVFIPARVIELDKKSGCAVMVDKGTNDQVRQGASAAIVGPQGNTLASGVVDQAFPKLSHVKIFGSDCNLAGAQVQIAGGY